MQVIPVTADYNQAVSFIANGQRVTLRLLYSVTTERWSFDLSQDDEPIVEGKRLLCGTDALAAHDLGLGALLFYPTVAGLEPNFANVTTGRVELIHVEPDELP